MRSVEEDGGGFVAMEIDATGSSGV